MTTARVESDSDLDAFFDPSDFGTLAVLTLANGATREAYGIFESPVASRTLTQHMDATTPAPTFACKTSAFAGAAEGLPVTIGGKAYTIRAILEEGTGVSSFNLEVAE